MSTTEANRQRARDAEVRQRARLVLRRAGMSDAEIALVMRTTPAAVRRALIRDSQDPWADAPTPTPTRPEGR